MPALKNPKYEAFAQSVALNMPAAQAYREGWDCSDATAETNGPRLARDAQVKLRIAELRKRVGKAADDKFDMTKDAWLQELRDIANDARQAEDFSAATGALAHIGKASSFFDPEKHTMEVNIVIGGNAEGHD
jgi:hypothetical protein